MNSKLFELLTDEELKRLKSIGQTRNVKLKDLTLGEVEELKQVFWPGEKSVTFYDVIQQFKNRKAI